jgi:DNA excision repair protein ERCC-3
MGRWGQLRLETDRNDVVLTGAKKVMDEIQRLPSVIKQASSRGPDSMIFPHTAIALVKVALAKHGFHVADATAATTTGKSLSVQLREDKPLRPYQSTAISRFVDGNLQSGVMVLPCGAGKTVIGVGVMAVLAVHTLVLVPNEASAAQWHKHILDFTTLTPDIVSIDDGFNTPTPVTITTYQRLTARRKNGDFHHLRRYTKHTWGLIIYDEVHLLPAPLFRLAADLQSARRLGLSATLIREDGRASDVFTLIGPKCYEVHTVDLVRQGYLSQVRCQEILVPLNAAAQKTYDAAPIRLKHRLAADNEDKLPLVLSLCARHRDQQILVMGHYTAFLAKVARQLNCPLLSGDTPKADRLKAYTAFRKGEVSCLVLSRIANVAVDLPNADVAIQISGLFGSRQEEAQRLGRLLRPKAEGGLFYTLVSAQTVEEKTARHRQHFLLEHGYTYETMTAAEMEKERMMNVEIE